LSRIASVQANSNAVIATEKKGNVFAAMKPTMFSKNRRILMIEIRALVSEEIRDQINARMALMRENGSRKSFPEVAGDLLEQKISSSIIFPTKENVHHNYCPGNIFCVCLELKEAESAARLDEKLNG
jgi:hypothetical protein